MNAVIGMTTHLMDEKPRPDQLENLKTLRFSAEHLMTILNDILDFSKIEVGKIVLYTEPFQIAELVESLERSMRPMAEAKKLNLHMEIAPDVPSVVSGDRVRISQVLMNLLNNAVKFTADGQVKLNITLKQKEGEQATIGFRISDTGIGMTMEQRIRVFESFTQAGPHIMRKYGGTGLGLTIVKFLLEKMNSAINLESETGIGSVFSFDLVLPFADTMPAASITSTSSGASGGAEAINGRLAGLKVLLAEDNPVNVKVVRKFLERYSVELEVAENGREALEMVQKQDFDAVLMDMQMPEMDGYEATRRIRLLGRQFQELPIIALTASAMVEDREKAMAAGVDHFVAKPFTAPELLDSLTPKSSIADSKL